MYTVVVHVVQLLQLIEPFHVVNQNFLLPQIDFRLGPPKRLSLASKLTIASLFFGCVVIPKDTQY